MEKAETSDTRDAKVEPCKWRETRNNPDWFFVECIGRKVNLWKACKKRGITPVQAFRSCPWCGKPAKLGE